jgi:hypothetical protein
LCIIARIKKKIDIENRADKEFKKFARHNLLKPGKCTRIDQTNYCIQQLHSVILEFKIKFNYVPVSAQLMFNKYQNIQDRIVYEYFRQSYKDVLC